MTRAPKSEVAKNATSRESFIFSITLVIKVMIDITMALSVTTAVMCLCFTLSIRHRLNLPPWCPTTKPPVHITKKVTILVKKHARLLSTSFTIRVKFLLLTLVTLIRTETAPKVQKIAMFRASAKRQMRQLWLVWWMPF